MTAYTEKGFIHIPEIKILKIESGWKTEALRGYGYVVAVINAAGECIGWAVKPNPIL